jgi:hypothetical protein
MACSNMSCLMIGCGVTNIAEYAFQQCTSLTNVMIPSNVTSIGFETFASCTHLASVRIENGSISIGPAAFESCACLTNVTITNGLGSIGTSAFAYCTSLGNAPIPAGTTSIPASELVGCSRLTNATIPGSVTSIGEYAFAGCVSVASVTIPSSVTNIADDAFQNCAGLKDVYCQGNAPAGDSTVFAGVNSGIVYYLEGTTGWGPTFGGLPTEVWLPLSYTMQNGAVTITGYSGSDSSVIIPGTINGVPVTIIGTGAFGNLPHLTSVTIPGTVTNIGNNAFENSPGLTSVYFQGNAPSIGTNVFSGDTKGTVYQSPGTTGWGPTFGGLPTAVWIQFTYTTHDGTITITGYTGSGGSVTIPGTINSLPVTSIGDNAFENLTRVTSVTIPDSVTNIGASAFEGCASVSGITIPDGVTTIGEGAFAGSGLTNATIPVSVTNIGEGPFADCESLTAITVDAQNSFYSSTNGVLFDKAQTALIQYPGGIGGSYTVPGGVTNIGDYAFADCTGLTNVTISASVTSIGNDAFENCPGLTGFYFQGDAPSADSTVFSGDTNGIVYYQFGTTGWGSTFAGLPTMLFPFNYTTQNGAISITGYMGSSGSVTIPGTINGLPVMSLGEGAFENQAGLTYITIPESLTSIGDYAFDNCISLTNITIPGGVTNIGDYAFDNCTSLTNFAIPGGVASIGVDEFYNCTNLVSVTIPAGVTNIGDYAFNNCISLAGVTIPDGVISLGNFTFSNCASLTSITMSNGITSIGLDEFYNCSNLTSVTIPAGVTNLGDEAFANCYNLSSLYFLSNAPSVGSDVFESDTNATVYYLAGTTGWGSNFDGLPAEGVQGSLTYSLNANDTITIVGYTGAGGAAIIPATIGGLPVASIGYLAFYGAGVTSVTILDGVTNIGDDAFYDCESLTNVTIPSSVASIGDQAFLSCYGLVGVFFSGNAPSVDASAFEFDAPTVYYVPGSLGWNDFSTNTGLSALPWNLVIPAENAGFGVQNNQFGFNINWASGQVIVVEACTNLANPVWTPLQTLTLTNGSYYFSEALKTNSPGRYYRIISP